VTVAFVFADIAASSVTTESTVVFRGTAGDPDEISEETLTVIFLNKLNLQRILVPDVRIQRSCPWQFPADLQQRSEAKDGGERGRFSRYFRCGYSADVAGGVGNLLNGQTFTSCDKSRGQCVQRGMFDFDSAGNRTARFGGFEFIPSAINVRTAGDKTAHISLLVENNAKYNDPVPIVFGTGWLKAPVVFARNDGNLTHMEVLAGLGPIERILKVVVNDFEIPAGVNGQDMTATGWFNVITPGTREGTINPDFSDQNGKALAGCGKRGRGSYRIKHRDVQMF
jgi:hypothetical protein